MMSATEIKAEQAAYWRFIRQMPIVAVEALDEDLLVVSASRQFYIIEVKVSAADMRADRMKRKHADIRNVLGLPLLEKQHSFLVDPLKYGRIPNYFYFAVPEALEIKAMKIRDEFYPYAGLILTAPSLGRFLGRCSTVIRHADCIHKNRIGLKAVVRTVKAQSASLANAYSHICGLMRRIDGISLHK
jgi:hypothetical protein